MPANRKSTPRRAARETPAQTPETVEAAEDEAAEDEAAPLNRAERRARARGKHGSTPPADGHGKVAGRSGPVQGPRMWSNRRGGG